MCATLDKARAEHAGPGICTSPSTAGTQPGRLPRQCRPCRRCRPELPVSLQVLSKHLACPQACSQRAWFPGLRSWATASQAPGRVSPLPRIGQDTPKVSLGAFRPKDQKSCVDKLSLVRPHGATGLPGHLRGGAQQLRKPSPSSGCLVSRRPGA